MLCEFEKLIYPPSKVGLEAGSYMIAVYKLCEKIRDEQGHLLGSIKAVGYGLPLSPNIRYNMQGAWVNDLKHGLQFEMESYEEVVQPTKEGIIAYLTSGQISGVGEKIAERIYEAFGNKTLEILDNEPKRLLDIQGIGRIKLEEIIESYLANRAARDTVAYLTPFGITANFAVKLYKEYGGKTLETVENHPYCLCELTGIGFTTADNIARKIGLHELSPQRADAALLYTLQEAETKGNLCLEKRAFIKKALKLLNTPGFTVEMLAIRAAYLLQAKKIAVYDEYVYLKKPSGAETELAELVNKQLVSCHGKSYADLDTEIKWEEERLNVRFADEQKQAIKTALTSSLAIITGGPGTGKTMIQRAILDIYSKNYPNQKIRCCAPTGRAARRMEQSTKHTATTIHKLLNMFANADGEFGNPEDCEADLILVDEVSMLDVYLARSLFKSIEQGTQLILIGDSDQLPSVGPGTVLSELIASGVIPIVRLEKVFRQNSGSRIAINAKIIRHGGLNLEYGKDFIFVDSSAVEESAKKIVDLFAAEVEKQGLDNVTVLSPIRQKTETGVNALNEKLQQVLNPARKGCKEIIVGKKTFRVGDKVMQTQNSEQINNGDIGYIKDIKVYGATVAVVIDFGDERIVEYSPKGMKNVDLGYATTVHKSQGSEYDTVIISLQCAHAQMLTRPLIYTAITRGKKKVIIVGEHRARCIAIKKTEVEKRGTCLAKKIIEIKRSNLS